MTYDEFKQELKALVRRTPVDRVGAWKRYLNVEHSGLEDFVVALCYSFLSGDHEQRAALAELVDDDDALWYFEKFIDRQVRAMRASVDTEALLLGLVAVVVIGGKSDPRDISGWIHRLYVAGRAAAIPALESYFEKVSSFAPQPTSYVAERMRTYPTLFEQPPVESEDTEACDAWRGSYGGLTPTMVAAMDGDLPRLFELIHQGADVNVLSDGASALAFAAFADKFDAVEMLLGSGACVDVRPHGMSLLQFASMGEPSPVIIERLKRAGAR